MPKPPTPELLREKLARQLAKQVNRLYPDDAARQAAFNAAFFSDSAALPALFWMQSPPTPSPFKSRTPAEWQPDWVAVLAEPGQRPASHPAYAEGLFYPLDFSSIAAASPLLSISGPVGTVLDVCSAPGGKALFAWRQLQPERLVCNEVIGKRHRALLENLERCAVPAEVTQLDPSQLASRYGGTCDVVLVDAPCSGQSLPARGIAASGAFQDHLIRMNMVRQRRILANAVPCLAPGGYLLYTTCTYSREENEKNAEWLAEQFPQLTPQTIPYLEGQRSSLSSLPCYRFEPQMGLGAGSFSALFKRD